MSHGRTDRWWRIRAGAGWIEFRGDRYVRSTTTLHDLNLERMPVGAHDPKRFPFVTKMVGKNIAAFAEWGGGLAQQRLYLRTDVPDTSSSLDYLLPVQHAFFAVTIDFAEEKPNKEDNLVDKFVSLYEAHRGDTIVSEDLVRPDTELEFDEEEGSDVRDREERWPPELNQNQRDVLNGESNRVRACVETAAACRTTSRFHRTT